MPNLVVYVPARLARSLEAIGVSEDLQRRACREVLVGLAEGGLGAGAAESAGRTEKSSGKLPVRGSGGSRPTGAPTASAPSSREVRPDFKGGSK